MPRNFRTVSNFIPIQAGGGDGNAFLPPTICYIENPLSDDIQKTEGAANLNMDDAVNDATNGGVDAAADAVGEAVHDVGLSSSSSPLSTSPTVDHVETTETNADDGGADVEIEEEEMEEDGGEE
ncbi:hypothetical protein KI688_003644 [Linnemannia hyalina]|uniref:Uncharacterized protein n=1 Tax=Linnemannia hyalina TaxID=64524 RepID=A0A9P7XR49_9FUNG|nr:hypothetical protein KI688_003644 [Linnemannia hyalina]